MYTILKLWIYQTIIIDLWINVILEMLLLQQKVCKFFYHYYGLITFVNDTATLTLIVFMLQINQYGTNKFLTLLLLRIAPKIHLFMSSLVWHSHLL